MEQTSSRGSKRPITGRFKQGLGNYIQAYLEDTAGSIPDHRSKARFAVKRASQSLCWWRVFPSIFKKGNMREAQ